MAAPEIEIERFEAFRQGDTEAIMALLYVLSPGTTVPDEKVLANINRQLGDPDNNAVFVARHAGQIVGKASVHLVTKDLQTEARLEDVAILPAYRGQGILDELEEQCVGWSRDSGGRSYRVNERSK